jgi:predicted ArsR family transcriptional regulator
VREVISYVYEPISAETVANRARTSPKMARKHLPALAEEGYVETAPGTHGGTSYRRSRESLVVEEAARILENVSVDELVEHIAELRKTFQRYESEYGVDSPEALTVEQTNRTLSASDREDTEIGPEDRRE